MSTSPFRSTATHPLKEFNSSSRPRQLSRASRTRRWRIARSPRLSFARRVRRRPRLNTKLVHLIAAARPNFMKVAPLYHELARASWCRAQIVHTGQHYDANMSDDFFRDLRLPEPAHHLEVGSGTHAEQTGRTMMAYAAVPHT